MAQQLDLLIGADSRLLDLAGRVDADVLAAPSPCAGWSFASVLSHTLQTIEVFSAAADGGPGPSEAELFGGDDIVGSDPAGVARTIVERSHAAWNAVSDWDSPVRTALGEIPAGQAIAIVTYSTLVHSWDLARAMGETVEFNGAEAGLAEAVGGQLVPTMRPSGLFGPEQPTSPDATPTERVIAFSGRIAI
ncbi:MAG TPA: TIGR03086 family metal-binding protein [Sporichthyaceae bacterium]|jgi:uncharacterized protein (TIGR03086 family)|nr:TIGR03086 family metal-binding protein [Sporichthyaceae bacterium]